MIVPTLVLCWYTNTGHTLPMGVGVHTAFTGGFKERVRTEEEEEHAGDSDYYSMQESRASGTYGDPGASSC